MEEKHYCKMVVVSDFNESKIIVLFNCSKRNIQNKFMLFSIDIDEASKKNFQS